MSDATRVELLFLWHHHQPDYRSPRDGRSLLPWVRLHATKDYLDMALRLERHERLRATFNFVPSLVDQLEDARRGTPDELFALIERPAADLNDAERAEVVSRCASPPPRLRDRWPRYAELCRRAERLRRAARPMAPREIECLEAWYLLAWIDPMFHGEREARWSEATGANPGAPERDGMLVLHRRLLAEVLPAYRRLAERGQVELSASPYAHPILPLLVSTSSALRARPDLRVPGVAFEAPEDAARQLGRAVARHAEVFGAPPRGLWPSEGSVSPEVATLVSRAGLRWMATDEGVLWASLPVEARKRGSQYRPWQVATEAGELAVFFRDRELSDRIGFVYHHWESRDAVNDFVARLRKIGEEHAGERPPVVSVILDGENCWEHYLEDGGPFLDALYAALDDASDIRTVTPSEVLERGVTPSRLEHLHSGSWIDSDFHIWIGHHEKNLAWELLARVRADLTASGSSPETDPRAWAALDSAEGSDWFWWLGTDHYTPDKALFDRIFREHLQAVYEVRGQPVPPWLRVPIVAGAEAVGAEDPFGFVRPSLDGRVTSYYEWYNAGRIDLDGGGSMHRGDRMLRTLCYGFDERYLYLRLDFVPGRSPGAPLALEIEIRGDLTHRLVVAELGAGASPVFRAVDGGAGAPVDGARAAVARVVELGIPLDSVGLVPKAEAALRLRLLEHGAVVESVPADDDLGFVVPGMEDESALWSV